MRHKLYSIFIEPRQQDDDLRSRELVLNTLLVGTLVFLALAILVITANYFMGYNYVLHRAEGFTALWAITVAVYVMVRNGKYKLGAWFIVALYTFVGIVMAMRWGVTMPPTILLFALIVMVSGTVLGSPFPLYVTGVVIVVTIALQVLETNGTIHPDTSWSHNILGMGTVVGSCLNFAVIAVISWLFNEQTERSLHRAHRAEAGLKRQKLLLESKVEERTRELQAAQLEKIQQLYRFAELGQYSTALLHDLANHLTTLTLDIEGLESETHSQVLRRAKRSMRYIDDMVVRVRDQLRGKIHIKQFNVATETEETMTILTHKASEAGVTLNFDLLSDKQDLRCKGEPFRFRQLMANMIGNAIDAYNSDHGQRREVRVTLETAGKTIIITITDWGRGIDQQEREKLFEPFFSTKKTGMGMGLFIAKQIVEENFKGTISLDNALGHTSFILTLAKE